VTIDSQRDVISREQIVKLTNPSIKNIYRQKRERDAFQSAYKKMKNIRSACFGVFLPVRTRHRNQSCMDRGIKSRLQGAPHLRLCVITAQRAASLKKQSDSILAGQNERLCFYEIQGCSPRARRRRHHQRYASIFKGIFHI
jgi:hypothetical protein